MARKPRAFEERFWEKVFFIEGRDTCWPWRGVGNKILDNAGRPLSAWMASYILNIGPIPKGKWVMRNCGDPLCVRPTHLYLWDAGHQGSRHYNTNLSEGRVIELLRELRSGMSRKEAAEKYGLSYPQVCNIALRRAWKHIEADPVPAYKSVAQDPARPKERRLTDDEVREIRERASGGEMILSLARDFDLDPSFISKIIYRRRYKDVE